MWLEMRSLMNNRYPSSVPPQPWITHPTSLRGHVVDLLPLEEKHLDELFVAASDKRIWQFYTGDWSVRSRFDEIYSEALQARREGREYPFVVWQRARGRIIGSTRILDIVPYDRRVEIGCTWLLPEYWGTAVNLDCKLALLAFCFEEMHCNRVQLKTQEDNVRSRKAIEKIGGVFEGVIRQHMQKDDGTFRSSAYFSILSQEWADVKARLVARLTGFVTPVQRSQ
jgi:RimJ/RimL family protein N-acetyltransferase